MFIQQMSSPIVPTFQPSRVGTSTARLVFLTIPTWAKAPPMQCEVVDQSAKTVMGGGTCGHGGFLSSVGLVGWLGRGDR